MVATRDILKARRGDKAKLLESLVHEELNGVKLYRKGYHAVLRKLKTPAEIMGSSSLQGIIISVLMSYLYKKMEDEGWTIVTNEIGLHISKGNNLSSDIILYNVKDARQYQFDDHYFTVAPKIVFEIDIKIELDVPNSNEYVVQKTAVLHNFGVERVIWILTKIGKIIIAEPNQDWIIRDWSKDFDISDGHTVNILKMIAERGFQIGQIPPSVPH